jgi:hypothetical protein
VSAETRDSAGVAIVENHGEMDSAGGGWDVSTEPTVSIGTFQGDTLYQLYEVGGAVRLSDGSIALANAGSGQIRFYDPSGVFLRSVGRKGEGPGEFEQAQIAGLLDGDTVVVVDSNLRRISLIPPSGGVVDVGRLAEDLGGNVFPRGMFDGGGVVVGGGFYWSSSGEGQLSDGYTRRPTVYRSASRDGSLATDFGEFPGSEFFMQVRSSGGGMSMMARLIPFGKYAMAAVGPDRFHFGSGDSYEIRSYAEDGRLARIVRWDRPPVPVAEAHVNARIEEAVAEASDPNEAREVRQTYAELPVPDFFPAFAGLEADRFGNLWVEDYRMPGDHRTTFHVFDADGRLVGRVDLPEEMELLDLGEDYLLALFRDDLEVEYVRQYRLRRPRP